jgi:hypothetical protein
MRLFLAIVTIVALALGGTALAQAPVVTQDLRAPDQQAPAQAPVVTQDLRAPDQQAPAQAPVVTQDLRAPDQQAPGRATPILPAPASDGGPAAIFFVLIGLGVALVLLAGGYLGVRYRHRVAIADDLVVH